MKSVGQTQTMDSVLHTPPFIQGHAGRERRGRKGEGGRERGREGEGGKERDEMFGFNQTHVTFQCKQTVQCL